MTIHTIRNVTIGTWTSLKINRAEQRQAYVARVSGIWLELTRAFNLNT